MTLSLQRLRRELCATPLDGLISLVLIGVLLAAGTAFAKWMLFQAQWAVIQANSATRSINSGACGC
jgi:general L-amino acid transport system permease protein